MDARARFLASMGGSSPDRPFWLHPWLWGATLERWHAEGLPRDVDVETHFGTDRREVAPIHLGLLPAFDEEVLFEVRDGHVHRSTVFGTRLPEGMGETGAAGEPYRIRRRGEGQVIREFYRRPDLTMPQWLDYSLRNRDDWEREFVPRLDPHSPARYPLWWEDYVRDVADRDYPLGISAGSLFGWLRNWIGYEQLSFMLYDAPSFVQEMADYLAYFISETIREACRRIRFDFALMWEDMAMKTGPLCSPKHFARFFVPGYRRITEVLHSNGIDVVMVDSDGQIDELVPLWLDAGVTGVYPLEVAAGVDAVALRRRFGPRLHLWGNMDKRVLSLGPAAIDREVLGKVPWLLTQGGYLPWIDHLVPPDVPLAHYEHYWALIRRVGADPERGLADARAGGYWAD